MRRVLLVVGFVGLLGAAYYAGGSVEQLNEAEIRSRTGLYDPLQQPDRISVTWAGDPATTQAVTWRTSFDAKASLGEIALATDGPQFRDKGERVEGTSEDFTSDKGEARYHSVEFEGLEPDTLYVFRVGDGEVWSEWNQIRTAKAETAPLKFLYVGDAQNDLFDLWSRVVREAYSTAPDALFFIHAGDLVNRSLEDAEWGDWFESSGWIHRKMTAIPAPGNHEYPRDAMERRGLAPHWRRTFTLPENGPEGLEETCYWYDVQGVRIVVMNSNEKQVEQAEWLDELLSDNPNRWTVVTHHHPIFSASRSRDNPELRAAWQPIYDKHKVDLVLTGHDHTYARSNLTTGSTVQSEEAGTVYVVSVSGPKMYELDREDWMARTAEDTQLFQEISIDGDTLEYKSFTARGELYDGFELHKRDGSPNEMIEKVPDVEERRRLAE